jgi:hypothetical protein
VALKADPAAESLGQTGGGKQQKSGEDRSGAHLGAGSIMAGFCGAWGMAELKVRTGTVGPPETLVAKSKPQLPTLHPH